MSARTLPDVLFVEDFDDLSPFQAAIPAAAAAMRETAPAGVVEDDPGPGPADLSMRDRLTEARDEGFAEGYRVAEDMVVAERVALLRRIETALDEAGKAFRDAIEADMECLAGVCLSLLLESFPALCERHGNGELSRILRSILPTLADEPVLRIAVNPLDEPAARAEVAGLLAAGCRVSIAVAGEMMRGDVCLTWENGAAIRDSLRARDDMLGRLRAQGLLHEPTGDAT